MSTGRIITNSDSVKARPPIQVYVSDGTMKFPSGHPEYFSSMQPNGMLLLDLNNDEYSEFRLDNNRDCTIHLYNAMNGARYKLFVYRSTVDPINLSFNGELQTYIVPGTEEAQKLLILDVEVAELQGKLINRIGPTAEKIQELVGALNTSSIKLSEDIVFNGVAQGSYSDGDKMTAGDTLTSILKKFAQKANPVSYSTPVFGITPNNKTVESGTFITPAIVPTFTQRDAGALNRYLLQLVTGGGAPVSLVDGGALQTYNQASIQVQDGTCLEYSATVFYDEGVTKLNNMGEPVSAGKILAGSLSDVLKYTGVRQAFYGTGTEGKKPATSADIRALTGKLMNPGAGSTFTLNIPAGTRQVVFAYPATLRDVESVLYVELGNSEVKDTFSQLVIPVEGQNNYKPLDYKVYVYIPAIPFGAKSTYHIKI